MRLAADGRQLTQHTVSDKFAKFADALYIAERQARIDIEQRNQLKEKISYNEFINEEKRLKKAADLALQEKKKILEMGKLEGDDETNLKKRKSVEV